MRLCAIILTAFLPVMCQEKETVINGPEAVHVMTDKEEADKQQHPDTMSPSAPTAQELGTLDVAREQNIKKAEEIETIKKEEQKNTPKESGADTHKEMAPSEVTSEQRPETAHVVSEKKEAEGEKHEETEAAHVVSEKEATAEKPAEAEHAQVTSEETKPAEATSEERPEAAHVVSEKKEAEGEKHEETEAPKEATTEKPAEAEHAQVTTEETKPAESVPSAAKGEKHEETEKPKEATAGKATEQPKKEYFPAKWPLENEKAPDTVESIEEVLGEPEPEGIDTVSLEEPQGNWLFKRTWWEHAEGRYDKIRTLVDKIWESRMNFFIKRRELDRSVLDPFYTAVGVREGELKVIISEMIASIEKEREKEGNGGAQEEQEVEEQEHDVREQLSVDQETLQQLMVDVEEIQAFDKAVDDALSALMDQINNIRKFEKQAWDNFKEIARVLSDTKARELYGMMNGAWTNIKNIGTYIDQDFSNHFTKLIEDAKKKISQVQEQIKTLKEKGIDFRAQAERIVHKEEQNKEQKEVEQSEQKEEKPKPKTGWMSWIGSGLQSMWDGIVYVIRLPYDLIFGK